MFSVRVDQYPKSIPVPDPSERAYRLLLRAHAYERSSRLVSATPVKIGALDGLEGAFASDAGGPEQMRVVMVGHRVYQISATLPDGAADPAPAGAFLASFRTNDH